MIALSVFLQDISLTGTMKQFTMLTLLQHMECGMRVKIAGVGAYLPEQVISSEAVMWRIKQAAGSQEIARLDTRLLQMVTGICERRYIDDDMDASDLALKAIHRLVAKINLDLKTVDALIFASASQDISEPATAHIVQHKLGISVPVFDVKNACNSFLNGIQVGEALIQSGQYQRVIVCVGESPSRVIRWQIKDRAQLRLYMAGYTFGDAGAAVLLEPSDDDSGIFYRKFQSHSHLWDIGGVFGGGSHSPRDPDQTYFSGNAEDLRNAFESLSAEILTTGLEATKLTYQDFKRIVVHQVTMPLLDLYLKRTGIPAEKVEITLPICGNMASASMGVALALAEERGAIQRGDNVLLTGLAGGISLGLMMLRY
jgi:acyl-CoA:acyl-CoA alkyltransferase